MIDAEARIDLLREAGSDPATAVLLLDVVIGHGAHPDPAGVLAPVLADLSGPAVVAHVLGTDADPQGLAAQREILAEAGCLIAPSGARAALLAAALARRAWAQPRPWLELAPPYAIGTLAMFWVFQRVAAF